MHCCCFHMIRCPLRTCPMNCHIALFTKKTLNHSFTFMQTGQSQKNSPPDSSMTQQDCLTFLKSSKVGKEGEPRVFSLCLARSMSGPVRVLLLDSTIQIWSTWRGGEHDPSIVNFPFGSTFKIWALPILWDLHHWYPA